MRGSRMGHRPAADATLFTDDKPPFASVLPPALFCPLPSLIRRSVFGVRCSAFASCSLSCSRFRLSPDQLKVGRIQIR